MSVDSSDFYIAIDQLELIDIDSATSEATGYPKEHLLDGNLMTAWKPTSTAEQVIIIDLNQTPGTNNYGFGFFLKNYKTDHSAGDFQVFHSTTGVGDWVSIVSEDISSDEVPTVIWADTLTLNRYLKFVFTSMSTLVEISALFIAVKVSITKGPQLRCGYKQIFNNIHARNINADSTVTAKNYLSVINEIRKYHIYSSTDYNKFKGIFEGAGGGRHLAVLVDSLSGTDEDPVVVRLGDVLEYDLIDHDVYEIMLPIYPQQYLDPDLGY